MPAGNSLLLRILHSIKTRKLHNLDKLVCLPYVGSYLILSEYVCVCILFLFFTFPVLTPPGSHGTLLGVVNAFVHVIMYSYYFLTSYRPDMNSLWWKKHITQIQLVSLFPVCYSYYAEWTVDLNYERHKFPFNVKTDKVKVIQGKKNDMICVYVLEWTLLALETKMDNRNN